MLLQTIRHSENGKVLYTYHGHITWVNKHLGEFFFEGFNTEFWGKTDYWEVIECQIPIGKITVSK